MPSLRKNGDGLRVLIVEDEGIIALDMQDLIEAAGGVVAGMARSGVDAVEAVRAVHPDVVLMDVKLQGGMDGIEAAEIITRGAEPCPVIFVTATTNTSSVTRMRNVGLCVAGKPVAPEEVIEAIRQACGVRETPR